ncbi:hypothetical protein CAPTEDRAFT_224565 [Capitella teleta]|uniref:Uncharacterized protein n=1 Tax=Capitella teleta TaxID=283909 RepID=R7VGG9_CAPTE|nr:hypothetical protein CAPTEDRAFT_224565 [Capitella teleta]|eukprot:ELU15411.1 hypothetical protein CAPTEDRAFT_224565 [Capitella teleta]
MATSIAPDVRGTELKRDIYETFQTSTGKGHHWRPGYYFPHSNFQRTADCPLPPELVKPSEIDNAQHYKTSTGTAHDFKTTGGPYGNQSQEYKRAPALYKVDYVNDHHDKLQAGGWKKPLTMGNQTSETHDRFRAEPDVLAERPRDFAVNPQGFVLSNHHTNGPSKKVLPTTENDKMKGREFYVKNKGILDLNDPYLTSTASAHRRFKPKELNGYPKKDIATYWGCEEYPKSWGHGLKHNPVPKSLILKEQPPMRDEMVFKFPTKVRRIPPITNHVPHAGLQTEYGNHFKKPGDVRCKEGEYTPVDTPFVLPEAGSKSTFAAPKMYKTEYTNIGSNRPITC